MERGKETLQLSPRDCLECNVPLRPLSFPSCNFLHRKNTMEDIFQTVESLLLTPTTQTREQIRKKEEKQRQVFFFPLKRFQRLKLRNPVPFEHRITRPPNGFGMICPRCSVLSKFQSLFSRPEGRSSTLGFVP